MSTSERDLHAGPDIFVSYRRTDKDFVEKLVPVLERLGPSVWWDADIEGGDDWRDSIVEHLAASRCLVIVFSEACNTSKQLKKELAVADHLDKAVIPVLIEQTEPRGFFLYELAPLNWISIHPAPMDKLDSVAHILVERLEEEGWEALPVTAPAALAPFAPPVPQTSAAAVAPAWTAPSVRSATAPPVPSALAPPLAPDFSPPVPPEPAGRLAAAETLPPPTPARDLPAPSAAVAPTAAPAPAPPGRAPSTPTPLADATPRPEPPSRGFRDVFPFRWVDFILPTIFGAAGLLADGDLGDRIGTALAGFVMVLAIIGLIMFPLRYYRRRSNPYRVARNLVISNVAFGILGGLAAIPLAESLADEGETVNDARVSAAVGFLLFGLVFAAVSFVIFFVLSRLRAKREYKESFRQV
jgi:hypothetical protein